MEIKTGSKRRMINMKELNKKSINYNEAFEVLKIVDPLCQGKYGGKAKWKWKTHPVIHHSLVYIMR